MIMATAAYIMAYAMAYALQHGPSPFSIAYSMASHRHIALLMAVQHCVWPYSIACGSIALPMAA